MTMTISPIYIWVGVLIFCLVAEACTVQLITIWFAVGSVGAMAAAAMGFGETVQLGVCLAVAIVMLLVAAAGCPRQAADDGGSDKCRSDS